MILNVQDYMTTDQYGILLNIIDIQPSSVQGFWYSSNIPQSIWSCTNIILYNLNVWVDSLSNKFDIQIIIWQI